MTPLLRASHPEPAVAVTVAAVALALGLGQTVWGGVAVGTAVLAGQLSVGWLNDLVDAPRDARVGRADKPVASGKVSASTVRLLVLVSGVLAVGLSLLSGMVAGLMHVVALVSAWAYDVKVKETAFSIVPYAVSFGLLTAFVTLGLPDPYWPPWWLVATASLLGSAAHFANTLPDFADDRATGVVGLPHRLGEAASRAAAALLVLAASATLVAGLPGPLAYAGLAVALAVTVVGLVLGRRPGSRAAFHAMLVVAVIDAGVLLAATL
ncbi:UbiA family prenyltransferase [Actinokineospora auranticolor]|uniref:4-hydroxybenzoate polyprenyltransferase n=1 Tax=Actinokineospora auranticolor TaxID=155976 RepID=A0A2S6GMI7_9PSEU|nr:UbiA family prenyltransferase [Actinokineospora auranticolor]PPK66351.1 4-hydroxybenzoate polyprenyltransferase [Actinokineospora auranticolor]